jgi:hypothetical protein
VAGEDPDLYKGPGGLTARQIFQAVRDGGKAKAAPTQAKSSSTDTQPFDTMSSKELRQVLKEHNVDFRDCFEKCELIKRAEKTVRRR